MLGRSTAPVSRSRVVLSGLAALWLLLTIWCGHLVSTVSLLREEVEERDGWLVQAESLRHQVNQLGALAERLRLTRNRERKFLFSPGLREELMNETVLRAFPEEARVAHRMRTWREAARPVIEHADALHDQSLASPALAERVDALILAAREFDLNVAAAGAEVRGTVARRRTRLASKWSALYGLVAFSIVALSGFTLLLWHARRRAEAIQLKERHFRTLVQTAQDLIWSLDKRGRWTFVNDAARRIFGHEPSEMLGKLFTDSVAPEHVEKDLAAFREIIAGGARQHHETVHLRKDGKPVVLLYNASTMVDARGRVVGVMGSATDVTDMREMQERLLLNERLQAVATLGGGIAHDFNNLLTVIIGQAQVAKAKGDLPPQLDRRLNSILDTAERARKLTEQLIAFARRRPLRKEVIDLVAVVRQMGDLMRGLAGERIRVQEVLDSEPLRIRADWSQIDQVVMNFIVNARDALPEGGTITVSVQKRSVSDRSAKHLGIAAGDWAVLEVSDDGVGMAAEVRTRIFEPFFTTKEPGKGTGLGLASVYGIVSQHGGTVAVRSTLGSGTCMQVYLPLVEEEAQAAAAAAAPAEVAS